MTINIFDTRFHHQFFEEFVQLDCNSYWSHSAITCSVASSSGSPLGSLVRRGAHRGNCRTAGQTVGFATKWTVLWGISLPHLMAMCKIIQDKMIMVFVRRFLKSTTHVLYIKEIIMSGSIKPAWWVHFHNDSRPETSNYQYICYTLVWLKRYSKSPLTSEVGLMKTRAK